MSTEMEYLKESITELKTDVRNLETRTTALERSKDVSAEQIKVIFNILNEVKEGVGGLTTKIDNLISKPGQKWEKFTTGVIMSVVVAAVTYYITRGGL